MIALLLGACTVVLVDIPCEDTATSRWSAISAGGLHSCGLDLDGNARCWGRTVEGQDDPPEGTFSAIASGYQFSCAVDADGNPSCWGDGDEGQAAPPLPLAAMALGGAHGCGVGLTGLASCWGANDFGQTSLDGAPAIAIAAGSLDSCRLDAAGIPHCALGTPALGAVPDTALLALVLGLTGACGLTADGALVWWGVGDAAWPPAGALVYTDVAAGADFACALDSDGQVSCWGNDEVGQASPPSGRFVALDADANGRHACALADDATATCWGLDTEGQIDVP